LPALKIQWSLRRAPGGESTDASRAPVAGQSSTAAVQPVRLIQGGTPAQPMLLHCADASGYRLIWRQGLAEERAKEVVLSDQCRRFGHDFSVIREKNSSNDCSMGMSFSLKFLSKKVELSP
jgi:hypothetical protein